METFRIWIICLSCDETSSNVTHSFREEEGRGPTQNLKLAKEFKGGEYFKVEGREQEVWRHLDKKTGQNSSRIELFDITYVQANGQAVNEPTQDALRLQEFEHKSLESEHKHLEADVELKEVKHLKSMLKQQAIQMVLSYCISPNNDAFACAYVIVLVTSQ
ncbi:hypothetical protein CFP56_015750, partial [Quercus suber]